MVTVYTKPSCPNCDKTKKLLDKFGVEYVTEDLTDDSNYDALIIFKARGFMAAPIVVTDQETWSGFKPSKIESLV